MHRADSTACMVIITHFLVHFLRLCKHTYGLADVCLTLFKEFNITNSPRPLFSLFRGCDLGHKRGQKMANESAKLACQYWLGLGAGKLELTKLERVTVKTQS